MATKSIKNLKGVNSRAVLLKIIRLHKFGKISLVDAYNSLKEQKLIREKATITDFYDLLAVLALQHIVLSPHISTLDVTKAITSYENKFKRNKSKR